MVDMINFRYVQSDHLGFFRISEEETCGDFWPASRGTDIWRGVDCSLALA